MIKSLAHIGLRTRNLSAASTFYQSLGFESQRQLDVRDESGTIAVEFLQHQGVVLELYQLPWQTAVREEQDSGLDHLAWHVADLTAAETWVKSLGYPLVEGPCDHPAGSRYFMIAGPDGERVEFLQPLNR
ncbi:VOC family protein [Pantoea sp. EA-12]|uniref:VOC family protein n=1 Tax=Pantoea sp. EA-12 TaxID=3043303 RepID=UPI0024B495A3|nr:VOC family protein [Pantoea sp. EA-12]MDI9220578.1 VOC family protein [Pantoea sp. EA-12]